MRFNIFRLVVPNGMVGVVTAVNHHGYSCGYVINPLDYSGFSRIWRPDGMPQSAGTILETQDSAWAWDINSNSQIVGSNVDLPAPRDECDSTDAPEAFYFDWTSGMGNLVDITDIFLGSGQFSIAGGINDVGNVVGTMSVGSNRGFQAMTYGSGPMPLLPGATNSVAMRINSKGLSVGYCDGSRVFTHDHANGTVTEILSPSPLGFDPPSLEAIDINETGQISATINIPSSTSAEVSVPALYDPNGTPPGFSAIPALPGCTSGEALGLNSPTVGLNKSADVVGTWFKDDGSGSVAFVKFASSTTTDDLNTLIPGGSGWVLQSAKDISDETPGNVAGPYIVGQGLLDGQLCSFILVPMPELPDYDCGQLSAEIRLLAHELTTLFTRGRPPKKEVTNLLNKLAKLCSDFQLHCDVPPPPGPRPR